MHRRADFWLRRAEAEVRPSDVITERKADRDGEHLLKHERPDELFECSVGEKLFFRRDCLLSYRITRYASTRRSNVHAAFAGLVEGSTVTGTWVWGSMSLR